MRFKSQFAVLVAVLMAGSMWLYVQRVLIPHQQADAAARGIPRGVLSDLYPRWYGTRELLVHHRDPYRPEITSEIQTAYYGRTLDPLRTGDPRDQQRFAYPVYVVFLLAPTVHTSFETVRTLAFWLLALMTAGSAFLWLRFMRWKLSSWELGILLALLLGSFPVVQGLKLEQLSLLVAALIAAAAASIASGQLLLAGFLLALATIKPQLVIVLAGWLLFWVMGDWRQRQRLLWGFIGTLALLLLGAEWLLPGWLSEFYAATAAYRQYAGGASLLVGLLGTPAGQVLSAMAVLGLGVVCWRSRYTPADSDRFAFVTALALAVTIVVVPTMATYNQLLLLPVILLAVRFRKPMWERKGLARLAWGLAAALLLWPWLVTVAMAPASLAISPATIPRAWQLPLYPSTVFPLAILALISGMGSVVAGKGNRR